MRWEVAGRRGGGGERGVLICAWGVAPLPRLTPPTSARPENYSLRCARIATRSGRMWSGVWSSAMEGPEHCNAALSNCNNPLSQYNAVITEETSV